jgi:hypothetical protein
MLLCLHVAYLIAAYALVVLAYFILPSGTNVGPRHTAISTAILTCAFLSFASGAVSMYVRSGKSESIALAFSTIAAFVLLFLA